MESDIREPLVDTAFNEQDITYVVTAEMPGVTKEDIKVKISWKTVVISSENVEKNTIVNFHWTSN